MLDDVIDVDDVVEEDVLVDVVMTVVETVDGVVEDVEAGTVDAVLDVVKLVLVVGAVDEVEEVDDVADVEVVDEVAEVEVVEDVVVLVLVDVVPRAVDDVLDVDVDVLDVLVVGAVVVVVEGLPPGHSCVTRRETWTSAPQKRPTRCAAGPTSSDPFGADSKASTRDRVESRTGPPAAIAGRPSPEPMRVPTPARSGPRISIVVAAPAVSTAPRRSIVRSQTS
ncbi:MAG TPA: hypothetical protein VF044_04390 [Actinomycetota bacterium]